MGHKIGPPLWPSCVRAPPHTTARTPHRYISGGGETNIHRTEIAVGALERWAKGLSNELSKSPHESKYWRLGGGTPPLHTSTHMHIVGDSELTVYPLSIGLSIRNFHEILVTLS